MSPLTPFTRSGGRDITAIDLQRRLERLLGGAHAKQREVCTEVVMSILGQDITSRLDRNLRQDKPWAYLVRSTLSTQPGLHVMRVTAPVQTDKTAPAMVELRNELQQLVKQRPITPAELDAVRKQKTLGLAAGWETHENVVDVLSERPLTLAYLTDRIGARLVNSPQMRVAERWTQQRFKDWRLSNVHSEGVDFGRGWSIERSSVRMLTPRIRGMRAIPIAWTPATQGAAQAPIIIAPHVPLSHPCIERLIGTARREFRDYYNHGRVHVSLRAPLRSAQRIAARSLSMTCQGGGGRFR